MHRIDQFLYQRVEEIGVDHSHSVKTPVARMLQIARARGPHAAADECDVVAAALGFLTEAVEGGSEVLMHEAAVRQVCEYDPDTVCAVGLQRAGSGVGGVAHFLRSLENTLFRRFSDVAPSVERLAHRAHGYAAVLGNVLQGNHGSAPPSCICFSN